MISIPQTIFYLFSFIAIIAACMVVSSQNPVRSALSLVLCFFASSGLWMLAQAEFLSLILILVYVGAVMTLFLFVIMMLNIDFETIKKNSVRYLPYALMLVGLLLVLMLVAIQPEHFAFSHLTNAVAHGAAYSNAQELGAVLYTHYVLAFELAAVLLLIAIVAAIILTYRGPRECKTQKPEQQIRVKREDRVRLVKMKSENYVGN